MDIEDETYHFDADSVNSYRGYYSDLSVSTTTNDSCTVGELLESLQRVLGMTLEGYKGGDFEMDADTPVWIADYGTTIPGLLIVDVSVIDNHGSSIVVLRCRRDEYA